MGFLSAYDGVERVTIPHPDREYWVDLKKNLSHGASERAEAHLQRITMVDGKPCPAPDVVRSQQERVLASIQDWNLDDDNGQTWPINLQSVRRLPHSVFEQLHKAVETLNSPPDNEERRRFPDEGELGDTAGHSRAAEPVDVLA